MSFDPANRYSKTFSYEEHADPVAVAHAHAAKFLPKGTVYEVRSFDRRAGGKLENIKNDHRAGWYYEPEMRGKAMNDARETAVRSDGRDGQYVGRFTVA